MAKATNWPKGYRPRDGLPPEPPMSEYDRWSMILTTGIDFFHNLDALGWPDAPVICKDPHGGGKPPKEFMQLARAAWIRFGQRVMTEWHRDNPPPYHPRGRKGPEGFLLWGDPAKLRSD